MPIHCDRPPISDERDNDNPTQTPVGKPVNLLGLLPGAWVTPH